jgi:hypothetical protein
MSLAHSVILSEAHRVILSEAKNRFLAAAVNCLGWTAILRSRDAALPLPQDDLS